MRIAVIAPNIPIPGGHGGSTHVTELVRALRRQHEVLPVVRRGSTEPCALPIGVGSAPGILRYPLALWHFPQCIQALWRFRPDAIYERFSAHGLGVLLSKALRVPVVSMVLDSDATELTLRGADRLITTAPHLVPRAYHHKLTQVMWGANTEHFRPDIDGQPVRIRHGFGDDEFIIGYTGAFYAWHGLETLVEAAHQLRDFAREHRIRFLLVGDGHVRSSVEAEIRTKNLGDRFVITGRVPYDEVPRYLAACDACVAPYNPNKHRDLATHGMFFDPLKVFEYLAAGKPTITLDSPNINRLFDADRHLLTTAPGDAEALAAAIKRLIALPDRGRSLGAAGRSIVCERYSWQAHADQLTGIFTELVQQRRFEN